MRNDKERQEVGPRIRPESPKSSDAVPATVLRRTAATSSFDCDLECELESELESDILLQAKIDFGYGNGRNGPQSTPVRWSNYRAHLLQTTDKLKMVVGIAIPCLAVLGCA